MCNTGTARLGMQGSMAMVPETAPIAATFSDNSHAKRCDNIPPLEKPLTKPGPGSTVMTCRISAGSSSTAARPMKCLPGAAEGGFSTSGQMPGLDDDLCGQGGHQQRPAAIKVLTKGQRTFCFSLARRDAAVRSSGPSRLRHSVLRIWLLGDAVARTHQPAQGVCREPMAS